MIPLNSSEPSRRPLQRFPDFGKEVRRSFEAHELCYDCAEFYGAGHGEHGCDGWPASRELRCADRNRLPTVMPGTCGQVFPPSQRRRRTTPQTLREPDRPADPRPAARPKARTPRQCACGASLNKGKRLCDRCRERRRKQSKRAYMRCYMSQRRSGMGRPGSDVPSPAVPGQHTHAQATISVRADRR